MGYADVIAVGNSVNHELLTCDAVWRFVNDAAEGACAISLAEASSISSPGMKRRS